MSRRVLRIGVRTSGLALGIAFKSLEIVRMVTKQRAHKRGH